MNARQAAIYALPAGVTAILYGGPLVVLQGIYSKFYGLSLTTIATILIIANFFDTVTDPLIGYISDSYHARKGSRKPFVILGALLFMIGAYKLFIPPENVTSLYFLTYFLVFYLGFTLFNIPHHAWGTEISTDSQSSTRIFTIRAIMITVGGLVFYSLPQLPFFDTGDFTPEILKWAVIISSILILPTIALCVYFVPNDNKLKIAKFRCIVPKEKINQPLARKQLTALWASIIHNKPFLLFLCAFFLWGIGSGSWVALLFIFIDVYLDRGNDFSLVALMGMGFGTIGLIVWSKVAIRYGKKLAWVIGTLLSSGSILFMAFLTPENSNLTLLTLIIVPGFVSMLSFTAFAPALLSDILDYSNWKFGEDFAGSYFAIYSLITKTNYAIGGAVGLAIAGWHGFDPSLNNHSSQAVAGLQFAAIWMPVIFLLFSIIFIFRMPIDSRRHAILRKAINRRDSRSFPGHAF